jgi:ribonuclease BN (tRNA processing enzyme)
VIKLHVVQAEYGDCFILESNQGKDKVTVLIDGGPYQTFEKHLKPTLQKLPSNRKLDLVVLSHIDNDHIIGLLDLFDEIKSQTQNGKKGLIRVGKLWHNSFNDLFELDMEPKKFFKSFLSKNANANKEQEKNEKIIASIIMRGFQQGSDLTQLAKSLKIPINPEYNKLVSVEDPLKSINLKNIKLHILGPTKENLEKLRIKWKKWLNKKKITQITQLEILQILDKSIPNLASIMFLVEIKYRKILFTGDGLGGDIVRILSRNAMLDKKGKFHVDVLKVPHHGSDRNVTREFFDTVLADY